MLKINLHYQGRVRPILPLKHGLIFNLGWWAKYMKCISARTINKLTYNQYTHQLSPVIVYKYAKNKKTRQSRIHTITSHKSIGAGVGGYGGRGIVQCYMGVVANAIPWPLYPQERNQVPSFVQESVWTSGATGTAAENLAPMGQCVGSKTRFTAWPCQDFNLRSYNM